MACGFERGEEQTLEYKTVSELIHAFRKKHEISGDKLAALPAPLGVFPLDKRLIPELHREGFTVDKHECGSIFLRSAEEGWERTFRLRTPARPAIRYRFEPALWMLPLIRADFETQSVVCHLEVRTGYGDAVPMKATARICWAVSRAHEECHPFIREFMMGRVPSERWHNLGFGPLQSLAELFEEFRKQNENFGFIENPSLIPFKPNPVLQWFLGRNCAHEVFTQWQEQLDQYIIKSSDAACV